MKLKYVIEVLKKTLSTAGEQTSAARDGIAEARRHIAALQDELTAATTHALPPADMTPRIAALVKGEGDAWLHTYGPSLVYGERALAAVDVAGGIQLPAQLTTWGALCAAFPDQACRMLEALVARVEYAPGPPLADRPALVERLSRELQELETAEETIVDQMNGHGVTIAHRPEVTERRALASRVQDLDEGRVRERRARQAAVDNRPRGGESQYLKTGRV